MVPRSEGGSDDESNIELICRPCHDRIHMSRPRARTGTRTERRARRTRIKAFKASIQFDCKPSYLKCRDCEIICLNYVLELLIIFFQWLDEVTKEAHRKAPVMA